MNQDHIFDKKGRSIFKVAAQEPRDLTKINQKLNEVKQDFQQSFKKPEFQELSYDQALAKFREMKLQEEREIDYKAYSSKYKKSDDGDRSRSIETDRDRPAAPYSTTLKDILTEQKDYYQNLAEQYRVKYLAIEKELVMNREKDKN